MLLLKVKSRGKYDYYWQLKRK